MTILLLISITRTVAWIGKTGSRPAAESVFPTGYRCAEQALHACMYVSGLMHLIYTIGLLELLSACALPIVLSKTSSADLDML